MSDERDLHWDGCVNVRDLGGLGQVRWGAVVRLEAPDRLSEQGWAAVWAHGVRTVLDLREPKEVAADLCPRPAGLTSLRIPLEPVGTPFYEHWLPIDNLASPLYYPAMLAEHPERVVAVLRAIATAPPGGVAVHCASGKDRTGLITLVLLTLAGASPAEIIEDYLRTYARLEHVYAEMGARNQLIAVRELLAGHNTTIEDALAATIAALPMPEYLLANGLSPAELAALRERLISG